MSKKIRLITAMLLLSLLIGAVAIFASANNVASLANQLTPAAAENIYYADFENGKYNAILPDGSEFELAYNEGSVKTGYGKLKGDSYISYLYNSEAAEATEFSHSFRLNENGVNMVATNLDYVVFDLDISTDKYYWNDRTYTIEEYEADLDGVKSSGEAVAAYPVGMELGIRYNNTNKYFKLYRDEGGVYIAKSDVKNYADLTITKTYLSNEVGKVDHLTIVAKVTSDTADRQNKENYAYFYLNGVKFADLFFKKARKNIKFNSFNMEMASEFAGTDSYSFCVDNISLNTYAKGYTSTEEKNLTNFDFGGTDPISVCNDIVYNSKYLLPGADFVSCGGKKVGSADLVNVLLANLQDGERIVASGIDVVDFTPPEGVESFEIMCDNGAEFTLSDEAKEKFVPLSSEGLVIKYCLRSVTAELVWRGIDGQDLRTEYIMVGSAPVVSEDLPTGYFDYNSMKYYEVVGWYWSLDGVIGDETTYPESEIGVLTESDFAISRIVNDGKIIIFPQIVAEGVSLAYTVYDSEGELYFGENEDIGTYTNINNLANTILNAPDGATVVLNGDGKTLIFLEEIVIPGERVIYFDINGQKIASTSNAFILSEKTELVIYSSVAGGAVTAKESFIYVPETVKNAYVQFGTSEDDFTPNETFDIVGGSIVSTSAEAELPGEEDVIEFYILGGKYAADGKALFDIVRNNAVVYSIDTKMTTTNGGAIFADSKYAKLALYNTSIVSDFSIADNPGAILLVLGNNTVASSDFSFENAEIEAMDAVLAKNNNQNHTLTVGEQTGVITFATFESEIPESVSKVMWVTPDGVNEFCQAEYWYVGSTLAHPEYDESNIPSLSLDNGWFDVEYSGWVNQGGTLDVLAAEITLFKPVASLVANVTGAKMNVSLYSNLSVNVYVPAPLANSGIVFTQDGVHAEVVYDGITGFALTEGGSIETDNLVSITYNDTVYYGIRTYVATYDLEGKASCYVKFVVTEYDLNGNGTIEDNEKNIPLTANLTTNFMGYVKAILETYGCGSAEAGLVFDTLEYKRECYKLYKGLEDNNAEELALYNSILEGHGENCECKSDIHNPEFTTEETAVTSEDYEELASVIKGLSYVMNADAPYFVMYVPKDLANVNITVAITGVNGESYELIEKSALLALDGENNPIVVTVGEVECYAYYYDFGVLCNANALMQITVSTDAAAVSGKYCLAEYIETNPNASAAKALYAVAKAFLNYKTY